MTEEFLHHVWQYRRFDLQRLTTTAGKELSIEQVGVHNHNAGPDFSAGKVRIDGILWVGNIEIHLKASDWYHHHHQHNPAYDTVILHVVFEHDADVYIGEEKLPTLELKGRISPTLFNTYQALQTNTNWVPCQQQWPQLEPITWSLWLDRLLVERLERKAKAIEALLVENAWNWEECLYQLLGRNFAGKVNAEPFELLTKRVKLLHIQKHKDSLFQIEALLFGQAGFLAETIDDAYHEALVGEYKYLKQKFNLHPQLQYSWKFSRMRPAGFPTLRLAQFAQLVFRSQALFSKVIKADSLGELRNLLQAQASSYWQTHYRFGKLTKTHGGHVGPATIDHILINTIAPLLFVYGKRKQLQTFCDRSITLLQSLPAERNAIIQHWRATNLKIENAASTQALLELKQEFCNRKKCLSCNIGTQLLKQ